MQLPKFHTDVQALSLLQDKWKSILDPIIAEPLNDSNILSNVSLKTGVNVLNHLLGKMQSGWILSDINAVATIYRSAAFSPVTLTLTSSATCVVSLVVF